MVVCLQADVLTQYSRFSLYNSPYVAHRMGQAIDLYPSESIAPSPVAGRVLDTTSVRCPTKSYATDRDHLIVVDTGEWLARILHVEPAVEPGSEISIGDPLGTLIRSGYFAPWVPNHLHLGFRRPDKDVYRASGSVPIRLGIDPQPLSWDGIGTVTEVGDTWATLDAPTHQAPGERFVGLGSSGGVLDGGFPHFSGGGLLGRDPLGNGWQDPSLLDEDVPNDDERATEEQADGGEITLLGTRIGTVNGRTVTWDNRTVEVNGSPVGLSCYCGLDDFGVKIVGRELALSAGESVTVTIV